MERSRAAAAALALLAALTVAVLAMPGGVQAHFTLDSGPMAPGAEWNMTFVLPRDFAYHCHPHPWMEGSLRIVQAEQDDEPVQHVVRIVEPTPEANSWGYEPAHLEIRTGDNVRWMNEGRVMHTVSEEHDHNGDQPGSLEAPGVPAVLLVLAILGGLFMTRRSS